MQTRRMAQKPLQERMRARGVEAWIGKMGFGVVSVSAALRDLALCFFEDFFDESKVVEIIKAGGKKKARRNQLLEPDLLRLKSISARLRLIPPDCHHGHSRMVHVMTTPGPLFRFAASVEVEDSG